MYAVDVLALVFIVVISRAVPHVPNFTPVISVVLFSGAVLGKRLAFIVPLAAIVISDIVLGFYGPLMFFVYGSYALIVALGFLMNERVSFPIALGSSFAGALIFFIVSNFGVWVLPSSIYPKTFVGLLECYAMAIPFFRNTLVSTMLFSGVLFGTYMLARSKRTVQDS